MLYKLQTLKDKTKDFLLEKGSKISVVVSSVSGSVMAMTIQSSAEGETTDVVGTVSIIMSCLDSGYTWIMKQPVLAACFVGGIVGTLIFGNIRKAKRAVK